jgi:hypothetical protein
MSDIDIELPLNEGHIAFAVCELKNNAIDSEVAALLEGKTPAHDKWVVQQVGNVYLVRRPVNAVAVDEANNDR